MRIFDRLMGLVWGARLPTLVLQLWRHFDSRGTCFCLVIWGFIMLTIEFGDFC